MTGQGEETAHDPRRCHCEERILIITPSRIQVKESKSHHESLRSTFLTDNSSTNKRLRLSETAELFM